MGICYQKDPHKQNKIQPETQQDQPKQQEIQKANIYIPKKQKKVRQIVKAVKRKDVEGNKMINDYIVTDFLGQGSFGKVKLAVKVINDNARKFAMKIFKKNQLKRKKEYYKDQNGGIQEILKVKDALQDVRREIAIMKKMSHPNLIQLYEVIDNPEADKIIMVIEYASDGQLIEWDDEESKFFFVNQEQFEPFSENFLQNVFRDCIKGMHYLHTNGIVHRDLKPQNILISEGVAKIADFGVSVIVGENDLLDNTQGTYLFMPPEACDKDQVKKGYSGKRADIWSLGVTFYSFTFLDVPFKGESFGQIFDNILNQELILPENRPLSEGLKDFLKFLLERDLSKRPDIQDVANHYWINQDKKNLLEEMYNNSMIKNLIAKSRIQNYNKYQTKILIKLILCPHFVSSIQKNWINKWKSMHHLNKGN